MNYIDDPILYSDCAGSIEWRKLIELSNGPKSYRRRAARRKIRRVVNELLRGIRPRIKL